MKHRGEQAAAAAAPAPVTFIPELKLNGAASPANAAYTPSEDSEIAPRSYEFEVKVTPRRTLEETGGCPRSAVEISSIESSPARAGDDAGSIELTFTFKTIMLSRSKDWTGEARKRRVEMRDKETRNISSSAPLFFQRNCLTQYYSSV